MEFQQKNNAFILWVKPKRVIMTNMVQKPKVAIIGAGSISHGKRLIDDLCTVEELSGGCITLMGNNIPRLNIMGTYAQNAVKLLRKDITIQITDNLERAIAGSNFVIAIF
ncbi:MAG: hypothetical protein ACPL4I_12750, partial [Bacteroidota bacterium]